MLIKAFMRRHESVFKVWCQRYLMLLEIDLLIVSLPMDVRHDECVDCMTSAEFRMILLLLINISLLISVFVLVAFENKNNRIVVRPINNIVRPINNNSGQTIIKCFA